MIRKLMIFVVLSLLIGCSAAETGNYTYSFIRPEVELANPKVYLYEVKIGDRDTRELRVYLNNSRDAYFIIVDSEKETGKNSFIYRKKEFLNNFENIYRKETLTIDRLSDAMDQAVSQYIQDSFPEEIGLKKN